MSISRVIVSVATRHETPFFNPQKSGEQPPLRWQLDLVGQSTQAWNLILTRFTLFFQIYGRFYSLSFQCIFYSSFSYSSHKPYDPPP